MPKAFTESIIEQAGLAWLESIGYSVLFAPGKPAAFYLGPLPKVISREIMINNVKNPSEIKI
jgi:hypothetical protein